MWRGVANCEMGDTDLAEMSIIESVEIMDTKSAERCGTWNVQDEEN